MMQVTSFSKNMTLNLDGKLFDLDGPKVMGIINVTPDSFYSGSSKSKIEEVVKQAERMISEGADFLDIGGYSTRPGAEDISIDDELGRIIPAIAAIKQKFPETPISLDTFRSEVARQGVQEGASIINDVSGGNLDEAMFSTVADLKVPYILMHMRGTPATMTTLSNYDDLVIDVAKELQMKVAELTQQGVSDIIIDPGFGFAKNISQNFEMLKNLLHFTNFEQPLLIGVSRKSMIYKSLGTSPKEALNGTSALHMVALQNGAQILRVHDVKEAKEVIKLFNLTFS